MWSPSCVHRSVVLSAGMAIAVLASLIAAAPGRGANNDMDSEVERTVDRAMTPLLSADKPGGIAVAVRSGGHTQFFNYGFADQTGKRTITSDLLFNVGSVRKLFEATLLAQGVLRGELKLDDPVAKYVSELHGDYIDRVTMGQLATHTSGLLLPVEHDPYPDIHYTLATFLQALNAWNPRGDEAPGKQQIYSHAGYVLLGLALERRYGAPIIDLIDRRVVKPLGMTSTLIPERGPDNEAVTGPDIRARMVQGYSADGEPVGLPGNQQSYYDFPGNGQMFSSARDLAIFVAACLGEEDSPALSRLPASVVREFFAALQFTQRVEFPVTPQYGQAMAWEVNSVAGPTVIDKPGGLNNASAYVGLVPARKLGIVILGNRGGIPFETGRKIILPELAQP
jgi:beta-lactamase class C